MAQRRRWMEGDVLRIDLGSGTPAYAQLARKPLVIFFEGALDDNAHVHDVARLPVAFRLWVFSEAVTKGTWSIIGRAPLAPEHEREPYFFKQDPLNGRLALYHSSFVETNYERPASLNECIGLECAAVWSAAHVEDRLRDLAAGRPNKWADRLLKIDRSRLQLN